MCFGQKYFITATERKLEQYGTVHFFGYRKLVPGPQGAREVFTFQSPSGFPSGSMEASTFSEMTTSPVWLSVTCEGCTRESAQTCFPPSLSLSCPAQQTPVHPSCHVQQGWWGELGKGCPEEGGRHLVYLYMAGEGMVSQSVLLVLFLMEVPRKVSEVHGGGKEVVQVL